MPAHIPVGNEAGTYVVDPAQDGWRLDVYLAQAMAVGRSMAQRLLKGDRVMVNGEVARASLRVSAHDSVRVEAWHPEAAPAKEIPALPIVYQDDDIVVIDKPAGISVHPGNGRDDEATVADFARTLTTDPDPERPGIVHRLDRDTSGLLVIARTPKAKAYMQAAWQDRRITKDYVALVAGRLRPTEAVIDLPLDRDPANRARRAVVPGGRAAVTRYVVAREYAGYSLVEARPETGRTHQLRVHFAVTGHAIAGDITYGARSRPLGLQRQFLHAARLGFTTPSGRTLELQAPLPRDLQAVLAALEKAA